MKLSFVKVSRGCFHLLNMQTFEHKKFIFYEVSLYPQNFLYPILDFLILLDDYLIGLAIMNDNMYEEHDVQHTIEVGNFHPKKIFIQTQICPKVPKHKKSMHKRDNYFSINKIHVPRTLETTWPSLSPWKP